jgi:hypothetical protein
VTRRICRGREAFRVVLLASAYVLCGHSAAAIHVDAKGCHLRADELERLVRLELHSVLHDHDASTAYRVTVSCGEQEWLIRIEDPITHKALERLVRAPGTDPEPERLTALSVAQLYRAAWLELLAEDPAPLPPAQPRRERPSVVAAARQEAEHQVPKSSAGSRVDAELGFAARGLAHRAVRLPSFGLRLGWTAEGAWWLTVNGAIEAGSDHRSSGRVQARIAQTRVGMSFEPPVGEHFLGVFGADAGLIMVSLQGMEVGAGFVPGRVEGIALDTSVCVGGGVRVDGLRLSLEVRAGVVGGAPAGSVYGDEPVDLNGPWIGALLRAGFTF